jgi:hypothetical protein
MDPERPPPDDRRPLAWLLGVGGEAALFAWLALMAWGGDDSPAMGVGEGLTSILMVGGVTSVLIVAGAVAYATGRRPLATVVAAVLLVVASLAGFVGGLAIALTRSDVGDH